MKKRILLLSTYPAKNPQHGGQKRLSAIASAYRKDGYTVKCVSVFHKKIYKDSTSDDIPLSFSTSLEADGHPWTSDIISGYAVKDDAAVRKAMEATLESFKPDVIHIEQPFIYLGLKEVLKAKGVTAKLIFGSQNIEGPMKREILEASYVDKDEIDRIVEIIDDVEHELAHDCDLLVACTQTDVDAYIEMGADRSKTVLAMNGIDPAVTTKEDLDYWKHTMSKEGISDKLLFVASAHPPSITGFVDMVGKGLGFLSRKQKILIAGSISDYLSSIISDENLNIEDATFWKRAYPCGRLSEERLGGLLKIADVILLPITEGGGSNLKTAEALLANKKLIVTPYALRSFEWAEKLPNIWIAKTRKQFTSAILDALDTEFIERTEEQNKVVERVLWNNQLKLLRRKVAEL